MKRRAALRSPATPDPVLLDNLARIRRQFTEWWPHLTNGEIAQPGPLRRLFEKPRKPAAHASALFYTGGVDSAYSLLQLHPRLKFVVNVEGFDIPLHDRARLETARATLAATVRQCGPEFVVVRTNLREHPVFNEISWEITHAAALSGIAHAMAEHVNHMYISASDIPAPWGSTPELDHLWSSSTVAIEHFGADLTRLDRVRRLAHWEPLRARLRVCWENNTKDLNCGFCEKCLRTRLELAISGAPDALDSFPPGPPFVEAVPKIKSIGHHLHGQWREIAALIDDPALTHEIELLLTRSQ